MGLEFILKLTMKFLMQSMSVKFVNGVITGPLKSRMH